MSQVHQRLIKIVPEKYRVRAVDCSCQMAVCRCPVDFVVRYKGRREGAPSYEEMLVAPASCSEWIIERVADGLEMENGSLEEMMALCEGSSARYPRARRAHIAEDLLRWRPRLLEFEYKYGSGAPAEKGQEKAS